MTGIMSSFVYNRPEAVNMVEQYGAMTTAEPSTSTTAVAQWNPAAKDYSMPLHVDCSIEYELPDCAKPPQGVKVEPLLMIHPVYFRKLESLTRVPFVNNMPKAVAVDQASSRVVRHSRGQAGPSRGRPPPQKAYAAEPMAAMNARAARRPLATAAIMGPPEQTEFRPPNRRAVAARGQQPGAQQPGRQQSRQPKRYSTAVPVQQFHPQLMQSVAQQSALAVNQMQPQYNPHFNLQHGPQPSMPLFVQPTPQQMHLPSPQYFFRRSPQVENPMNLGSFMPLVQPQMPSPLRFAQQVEQMFGQQAVPQLAQQMPSQPAVEMNQQHYSNTSNVNEPPVGPAQQSPSPDLSVADQELLLFIDEILSKSAEKERNPQLEFTQDNSTQLDFDIMNRYVFGNEMGKFRLREEYVAANEDPAQAVQNNAMQDRTPTLTSNYQRQADTLAKPLVANKQYAFSQQTGGDDCDNLSLTKIQGNLTTPPDFLQKQDIMTQQQMNVFYVE